MRGFTLLELVIVIVIMALVAAAAAPAITGRSGRVEVETAAREVAARLRQTRSAAIAGNIDIALAIDVDRHAYAIGNGAARSLPPAVGIDLLVAETERLGRRAGAIRFFPDGSSTGGEVRLSGDAAAYRVAVDWLTGQVRIDGLAER